MNKPVILQPAYVLHNRLYRESSLLIELFTENYGRITLIAKGVRRQGRSTHGLLQPFLSLLVSWSGKSELKILTDVELRDAANPATLHGENLYAGFYLNELLIYLLQKWDSHPKLFTIYAQTLQILQKEPLHQRTLRIFEKRLLDEIGYGLFQSFAPDHDYQFLPESGFVIVKCNAENKTNIDKRYIFSGKSLLAIASEQINDDNLLDAKRLMRVVLAPLLGDRTIYSRQLFAIENNSTQ